MKKLFRIFLFFLVLVLFTSNFVKASDDIFVDSFESYNSGNLNEQDGWVVTNYYDNPDTTINVSPINLGKKKIVEITSQDSITATRDITPSDAGIFQFRMRHNKSGLFYFNALTSDAGGQLLFSIQFTESKGILLEEADKQITLLPDYEADKWYLFTIDFDKNRGEKGTFKIKIDDGNYSEYGYVDSESALFDFAKITFGSESSGEEAISAFDAAPKTSVVVAEEIAEENSDVTSISADLSDEETVTAPIDGVLVLGTPEATTTEADSPQTAAVFETVTHALDAAVETFFDITGVDNAPEIAPVTIPVENPVEEPVTTSSVTGDTNTNDTTTTTF